MDITHIGNKMVYFSIYVIVQKCLLQCKKTYKSVILIALNRERVPDFFYFQEFKAQLRSLAQLKTATERQNWS